MRKTRFVETRFIKTCFVEKGFSLIEIVIASLIFTIFALGIFNCINDSFKNIITSRNAEIATNLCQEEMEIIKKYPYEFVTCPATFTPTWSIKISTYSAGYPTGNFPPVMYPGTYTTCRCGSEVTDDSAMCTLTEPPHDHKDLLVYIGSHLGTQITNGTKMITTQWVNDPQTIDTQDYKKITVTIKWQEGVERTREVSTYISKK